MASLTPIYIAGINQGLTLDKKPFLLPEQAFPVLENAYVWRERVKKRQGNELLGRLRRVLTTQAMGNISAVGAGTFTFNIFTGLNVLVTEPNAQIELGSITPISIAIGAPINQTLTDALGTGVMTVVGAGPVTAANINYSTGDLSITFSGAAAASAATFTGAYYPSLTVMGIDDREIPAINDEQTIFLDTKYAYIHSGTGFQEFIPGTTWAGSDSDFFWSTNYRGILPSDRIFFVTNFVNDAFDPMRYVDTAGAWQTFAPGVAGATSTTADTVFMFQAKLLIPYYGRLLAFNTWEGTSIGTSVNIFNRCRFSQVGNPLQQTVVGPPFVGGAWRSDVFGKGGFVDAPTNEAITSVKFFKNTLLVGFERSRWQLRYVGEYGLPFIWERVSADFGTESTFSEILFDDFILSVGDRAIVAATDVSTRRIDEAIPDLVFTFSNTQGGLERVNGIRDYQRELVFWAYNDWESENKFPNTVLVYNYRNNTFATFRDNVTFFGTFQPETNVTWDSLDVFWDDMEQTWDDADQQALFPRIVSGNQQGYIQYFGYTTQDQPSLSINNIDFTVSPNVITVPNHNMKPFDVIYLTGLTYSATPSADLNNRIFQANPVYLAGVLQPDLIALAYWTGTQYADTPASAASDYIGGGQVSLFPLLNVQTKDINPFKEQGLNVKLSYIDFLTDATPSAVMTIVVYINTSTAAIGNLLVGNKDVETYLTTANNFYVPGSDYAWHRFFATLSGQFFSFSMTYSDALMNDLATHQQDWILNAITLNVRPGGRQVL